MVLNRVMRLAGIPLLFWGTAMGSAFAHHSFAMFDSSKSITIVGTVKNVAYANPHVWVDMVSINDKNETVTWGMEGGNLGGLYRMGWTKDTIKVGDKITMEVHPLKDGSPGGQIMRVTLADGRVLGRGAPAQER